MMLIGILISVSSCDKEEHLSDTLFLLLDAEACGVDFSNDLVETQEINYFTYPYIYMGGGVAVGDINGDLRPDLYFTSNMGDNTLYLNITEDDGPIRFENISRQAGVTGDGRWDTGVTMCDVNADGLLDIYVSISGKWESTGNLLYINNGDLTFSESAEEYGLNDPGQSTQAAFFDYDGDGDLDVYVANYPALHFKSPNFVYSQNVKNPRHETSDHLYRNDGDRFVDVTEDSGVLNFGLSLGVSIADFNNDGLPDIYVSNDFASPDFYYVNQGDGTFINQLHESFNHSAYYGMGCDAADINNDGFLDFFQVDMTPSDNFRSKANMASMDVQGFREMESLDLAYQYMENCLQLNHGTNQYGFALFGDISRMTGTALTDWSWSPLIADFDNDGMRDLVVTNGTRRDINNKDFFNNLDKNPNRDLLKSTKDIPSVAIPNKAFRNEGDFSFGDVTDEWGLSLPTYSNGSAYADLDNDGDLDLVVNNIDQPAMIYQNTTRAKHLRVRCEGPSKNPAGIGSKVEIWYSSIYQVSENHPTRGFQSSSEQSHHFGLGDYKMIDSLLVTWPDGNQQRVQNIPTGELVVNYSDSKNVEDQKQMDPLLFSLEESDDFFLHEENNFDDYKEGRLMPHTMSRFGPALAVADVDNDGLEDYFVGGASGQSGVLYIQTVSGDFSALTPRIFLDDLRYEDQTALFFDADGDGWVDLYVGSGGSEWKAGDEAYEDRLYRNVQGNFVDTRSLPVLRESVSKVKSCDFDNDGDLDLLVSSRQKPGAYGQFETSRLLENQSINGEIKFEDVTAERLDNGAIGMVTDFDWTDYDLDGDMDILLVGEWMEPVLLENRDGHFSRNTNFSDESSTSWWSSLLAHDFNQDGRDDYLLGNLGLNYKYQASLESPFEMYLDDFDGNQKHDIVLAYSQDGTKYPVRGLQCSAEQIPDIKKKFTSYNAFAEASINDIYGEQLLERASVQHSVTSFASQIWYSKAHGGYEKVDLPRSCQLSQINAALCLDFDQDGNDDLLLAGNLFGSEPETKRNDASVGVWMRGNEHGTFSEVPAHRSNLFLPYDVKDMKHINTSSGPRVLLACNDDYLRMIKY